MSDLGFSAGTRGLIPMSRMRDIRVHLSWPIEIIGSGVTAEAVVARRHGCETAGLLDMAILNIPEKEINLKIVYYGTGLGGKTTNLRYIHNQLSPACRGDMISLATETERTLFFD